MSFYSVQLGYRDTDTGIVTETPLLLNNISEYAKKNSKQMRHSFI